MHVTISRRRKALGVRVLQLKSRLLPLDSTWLSFSKSKYLICEMGTIIVSTQRVKSGGFDEIIKVLCSRGTQ